MNNSEADTCVDVSVGHTHGEEAEAQHVVDAQGFELQDDRSQIGALHLGDGGRRQLLKVLL